MKILVLSSRFPYPLEKGDKLRLFHALRFLAKNHEIHLAYISENEVDKTFLEKLSPYLTSSLLLSIPIWKRIGLGIYHSIFDQIPFQVAWTKDSDLIKRTKIYAEEINPDIVFCQLIRMAEYAKDIDAPKFLDFMDALSVSMSKRSRVAFFPYNIFYRRESVLLSIYEQYVVPYFEVTSTISPVDSKSLKLDSADQHLIIPNGVDTAFFNQTSNGTQKRFDLGFIGNLSYLPNVQAVEYLYNQIFKKSPEFKYLISGAQPIKRIKKLNSDNFVIRGWVEDIRNSYNEISIIVAPIFTGTGQQNKILEAMSLEIPCITTTAVNDAIGAEDGISIVIANNPQEFLEKIRWLKKNQEEAKKIGENGRQHVLKYYSWEKHIQLLEKSFNKAIHEYSRKKNRV